MRDFYEVIGVNSTDDISLIKKAYFKLALQLHPDRNQASDANERFQELQTAWETLSDPSERAFYDRHKDDILLGDLADKDGCVNLYAYFNTSVFKGFDASEKSFFKVYSRLFQQIVAEEEIFLKNKKLAAPLFGDSDTPIADTLAFYTFFEKFSSAKPFAAEDIYDLRSAEDSKTRKYAKQLNEKERSKARAAYSDDVRKLARFIKKIDPRIKIYEKNLENLKILREKNEKIRVENLIKKREEEKRLARERRAERLKEQEEEEEIEPQEDLFVTRKEADVEVDEALPAELIAAGLTPANVGYQCAFCSAKMRTVGEFKTHLNSKKHKTAMKELCSESVEKNEEKKEKKDKKPRRNKNKSDNDAPTVEDGDPELRCKRCGAQYTSKTKLFKHLQENPSHASIKTDGKKKK